MYALRSKESVREEKCGHLNFCTQHDVSEGLIGISRCKMGNAGVVAASRCSFTLGSRISIKVNWISVGPRSVNHVMSYFCPRAYQCVTCSKIPHTSSVRPKALIKGSLGG